MQATRVGLQLGDHEPTEVIPAMNYPNLGLVVLAEPSISCASKLDDSIYGAIAESIYIYGAIDLAIGGGMHSFSIDMMFADSIYGAIAIHTDSIDMMFAMSHFSSSSSIVSYAISHLSSA